jgi:hypothetical protein
MAKKITNIIAIAIMLQPDLNAKLIVRRRPGRTMPSER